MDIYDLGFVQCFKDLVNYFKFKKSIRHEFYTRDSKFNAFKLKRNWLGNVVYVQLDFKDEDLMNFNYNPEAMVLNKIHPIVDYLGKELGWSDYLVPQISNFVDEDENPSLSYGVLFVFTPFRLTPGKFIMNAIVSAGIIAGVVFGLVKCLA